MDSFRIIPGDENHTLLIVGGRKNHVNSADVIDFRMTDGTFLYHSSMKASRINPKVLRIDGDFILLGGGISHSFAGKIILFQKDSTGWLKSGLSRRDFRNWEM